MKDVIFVTDDDKDDWWQTLKGKTIGLHPELINEITREGEVDRFYAYNTGSFLKYANEQLHTKVTEETIEEVNEVALRRKVVTRDRQSFMHMIKNAEEYVFNWLSGQYENVEMNYRGFPDIIVYQGEFKLGFEIRVARHMRSITPLIRDVLYRAYHLINEEDFDEISIVTIVTNEIDIDRVIHLLQTKLSKINANIKIVLARIEYDEESGKVYDLNILTEVRGDSL